VILGLIVLNEPVGWPLFFGGVVVLSGVALVVNGERLTSLGQ
jgi:drug/metabolite transporter (DMT)-like permease